MDEQIGISNEIVLTKINFFEGNDIEDDCGCAMDLISSDFKVLQALKGLPSKKISTIYVKYIEFQYKDHNEIICEAQRICKKVLKWDMDKFIDEVILFNDYITALKVCSFIVAVNWAKFKWAELTYKKMHKMYEKYLGTQMTPSLLYSQMFDIVGLLEEYSSKYDRLAYDGQGIFACPTKRKRTYSQKNNEKGSNNYAKEINSNGNYSNATI
jgi:hypothetical protein